MEHSHGILSSAFVIPGSKEGGNTSLNVQPTCWQHGNTVHGQQWICGRNGQDLGQCSWVGGACWHVLPPLSVHGPCPLSWALDRKSALTLRCLAHPLCADMLKSRRISRKIWRNFISDHASSHQVTNAQYLEAGRSVLLTSPLFYREGFLWAPLQATERLLANPISVSLSAAKAQILCIGVE